MNNKIFETHAHYEDEQFNEDRNQLIDSLKEGNVGVVVNVGSDIVTSRKCIELSEKYKFIYAAAGIHPEHCRQIEQKENVNALRDMLMQDKVVAVGEIGLDYHYDDSDEEKKVQKEAFDLQLKLAAEYKKPIIVHSRDASKDTFDMIHNYYKGQNEITGVIHCFSGSHELASEYTKLGFMIGIGGAVTFKNSKKLVRVVENTDIEHIVLETDCPYMAPEPHRGSRNNSLNLIYVAQKIADIKGISVDEVIDNTYKNACKMYLMENAH